MSEKFANSSPYIKLYKLLISLKVVFLTFSALIHCSGLIRPNIHLPNNDKNIKHNEEKLHIIYIQYLVFKDY